MSDEPIKIAKGDVIRLEYDGWIEDTEEMFDTTSEDKARENDILNENATYAPISVLVGAGRIFEGLDEALEGAEVGVEQEVTIPPEKAAGDRDPKLVELHSLREFHRQDIDPRIGMEVNIKNRVGTVVAVTAERVRVDFNRPLAGSTLRYKFNVAERLDTDEDRIKGILEMDYGTSEGFEVEIEDDVYSILLPDVCKYDQKWTMAKYRIVADVREAFGNVDIRLIETYLKTEEPEEEEIAEEEITEESAQEIEGESEEVEESEEIPEESEEDSQ
jgi:FKBP-type peptidyl-prolyl cis-trans isomerase 2